jgi:hypothetical protein
MKNSYLSKKKIVFVVSPIGGLPRPWESSATTRPSQSLTSAQHSLASATIWPNLPPITIFSEPSLSLTIAHYCLRQLFIAVGHDSSPSHTSIRPSTVIDYHPPLSLKAFRCHGSLLSQEALNLHPCVPCDTYMECYVNL